MVKKVVRKQRGGGFKPLRIGGTKKNPRQAKPGYDQEFTLPKGGSAAPIKQVDTSKYTRAKTTSGDKVFGNKKSVWSGLKKKDASKYILKPAKAAHKAQTKKNIKALRRPAMSAALTTVVGSELGRQKVHHRMSRERFAHQKKQEQKKSRTRSRASQRGVKKRP